MADRSSPKTTETYLSATTAGGDVIEYVLGELIYESSKSVIYHGVQVPNHRPVIVKILQPDTQTPRALARIKREYDLICSLNLPGIRRCLGMTQIDRVAGIMLEDVGGITLKELIASRGLNVAKCLTIGIKLATILAALHERGVIHKDINPCNILVHPSSLDVYIIDFDIAACMTREQVDFGAVEVIEGTLTYVAPEQTGRTGHPLDERSDLYSLGATLYEALTSRPVFSGEDAMDLVYAHLARVPTPPHVVHPSIPETLSALVLKLLAKDPSARYKSALGVKVDLEEMRYCILTNNWANFIPGRRDAPLRLNIPQKIYGREAQRAKLLEDFAHVEAGGCTMTLIAGPSGSGKTALLMELASSMLRTRAILVQGKFDEMRKDIPYDAIIRALRSYVETLLGTAEDERVRFRNAMVQAVGPNCRVLIDSISELAPLLGEFPPVPMLHPTEQKNRFLFSFVGLAQAISAGEYPLVLFMDDLQWADMASLELLGQLVGSGTGCRVLLMATYRDNEIGYDHPLHYALQQWEQNETRLSVMQLTPMDQAAVTALCSDALQITTETATPLASIILAKTGGNAFFVQQFLRSLYRDNHINFNLEKGEWQFDLATIRERPYTAGIIGLLSARIYALNPTTLELLHWAAIIGDAFDLDTLSRAMRCEMRAVLAQILPAIQDELVVPVGHAYRYIESYLSLPRQTTITGAPADLAVQYRFTHDKVREACLSGIDDGQQAAMRLCIGRLLCAAGDSALSEEELVAALNHLNAAAALITSSEERLKIAGMNLRAGKRAWAASSWGIAAVLFHHGERFLPADPFRNQYDLARELAMGAAACDTLAGNPEDAEKTFAVLLHNSRNPLEYAQVQQLRSTHYMTLGKNDAAIEAGLTGLLALGIRPSRRQNYFQAVYMILRMYWLLRQTSAADVANLPASIDPAHELATSMLLDLIQPSALKSPLMALNLIYCAITAEMKHGLDRYACHVFLTLASAFQAASVDGMRLIVPSAFLADMLKIWRLLLPRHPVPASKDEQEYTYVLTCAHLDENFMSQVDSLVDLLPKFISVGNFSFAVYGMCTYTDFSALHGENLSDIVIRIAPFADYAKQLRSRLPTFSTAWEIHYNYNVLMSSEDSFERAIDFIQKIRAEDAMLRLDANAFTAARMIEGQMCYMMGHYRNALAALTESYRMEIGRAHLGSYKVAWFYVYLALTISAVYPELSWRQKFGTLWRYLRALGSLRVYSRLMPQRFRPHYLLVLALWHRTLGRHINKYGHLLEEVMSQARNAGDNACEALAAEILGKELLAKSRHRMALGPLATARSAYGRWGIRPKTTELNELLRCLEELVRGEFHTDTMATSARAPRGGSVSGSRGSTTVSETLATDRKDFSAFDAPTLVRAAGVLSGEIQLNELKKKMMQLVCQNAGARTAFLLMPGELDQSAGETLRAASWQVVASASVEGDIKVDTSIQEFSPQRLSATIVQHICRSKERLIIGDAVHDRAWSDEATLKARGVRSVLALPIMAGGQMKGILYLENELIPHAFAKERIQLLGMLSGQMAISLENALLYSKLEAALHAEREALHGERQAHADYVKAEGERQFLAASMEAARAVQDSLLSIPEEIPGVDIAHFYRPADRAGGDWYACYHDEAQQRLYLLLGDVTGHGISSALVTAAAAGAAASAFNRTIGEHMTPSCSLQSIGEAVHEAVRRTGSPTGRVMTMVLVAIDTASGSAYYLNAGQTPVIHLCTESTEILMPGTPLGLDQASNFGARTFQLAPNDQILLFSDGLIENRDHLGHKLSRNKLRKMLNEAREPSQVSVILQQIVGAFAEDDKIDDTSFIIARWRQPSNR